MSTKILSLNNRNESYASIIDSFKSNAITNALAVIAGSLLIVLSAQVYINLPFTPVPITLQTLSVMLLGSFLGSKKAPLSVLLYIAYGALGFPVFSDHSGGLHVLIGATGGYIFGFIITAYVVGKFASMGWDRSFLKSLFVMLVAQACIFVPGLLWLSQFVGFENVLAQGFYPFVVGGILKILIAGSGSVLAWKWTLKLKGKN